MSEKLRNSIDTKFLTEQLSYTEKQELVSKYIQESFLNFQRQCSSLKKQLGDIETSSNFEKFYKLNEEQLNKCNIDILSTINIKLKEQIFNHFETRLHNKESYEFLEGVYFQKLYEKLFPGEKLEGNFIEQVYNRLNNVSGEFLIGKIEKLEAKIQKEKNEVFANYFQGIYEDFVNSSFSEKYLLAIREKNKLKKLFLYFVDWDSLNKRKEQSEERGFTKKEFEEVFLTMCTNELKLLKYHKDSKKGISQILDFINYQIQRNDFWDKMKQTKEKLSQERKKLLKDKINSELDLTEEEILNLSENKKIEYLNQKIPYLGDFALELKKLDISKKEKLSMLADFIYLRENENLTKYPKLKEIYLKHKKAKVEEFTIKLLKQNDKLEKLSSGNFKELKKQIQEKLDNIQEQIIQEDYFIEPSLRLSVLTVQEKEYEKLTKLIEEIEKLDIEKLSYEDIKFKIYDKIVGLDFGTLLAKELLIKDGIYTESKSFLGNLCIEKHNQDYQKFLETKPEIEVKLDKELVKATLEKLIKEDLKEYESYLPEDADEKILNLSMSVLYNMIYSEQLKDKFADYLKENGENDEILKTYLQNRKIIEQFHLKTIGEYTKSALAIALSIYFTELRFVKLPIPKKLEIIKKLMKKYPKVMKMMDLVKGGIEVDFYDTMLMNKGDIQSRFQAYEKYFGTKDQFYNLLGAIYLYKVGTKIDFSRLGMYAEFSKDTMLYYLYSEYVKALNNRNYDVGEDNKDILDIAIQMMGVYATRVGRKLVEDNRKYAKVKLEKYDPTTPPAKGELKLEDIKMDEILETYKDVFDIMNKYAIKEEKGKFTKQEADLYLQSILNKKYDKILKQEAERKGIKYDEMEFIKVKEELVENSLNLKEVIRLSKKIKNVKIAVIEKFGPEYKEILGERIVEVLRKLIGLNEQKRK